MFDVKPRTLYNPQELFQEHYIDFDIMREKPVVFKTPRGSIVCMPVVAKDSPLFLKRLSKIIVNYYEVFHAATWLNNQNYQDKGALSEVVDSVSIFSTSKKYKKFMCQEIPRFISDWSYTTRGKGKKIKFVRIKSLKKAKKLIADFSSDELLQIFFTLVVFNYDIVKWKTENFLKSLGLREPRELINHTPSSPFTENSTNQFQLPKYSKKPFNKQDLNLIERGSSLC